MRLIDADALLKSAGIFEAKMGARGCGKSILHLAKAWLFNEFNKAPTIDAVPVVRCKDCKWWGGKYSSNECSKITTLSNPDYWLKTLPEDFCSSGERRDDDA